MDRLKQVRLIAEYQFGKGAGEALFPDDACFRLSATNRTRQILDKDEERIATLRASNGVLTLSIEGAKRLHAFFAAPNIRVTIMGDVASFIREGQTLFAKHVLNVDPDIRSGEEVLVVDENDILLGTGKALLCAEEMLAFNRGVAVDMRAGVDG